MNQTSQDLQFFVKFVSVVFSGTRRINFRVPAIAAIILLLVSMMPLHAGVKLASVFGDHMVLQRDRQVCIWGTGDSNATITVGIADQSVAANTGVDGRWAAYLKPMPAGGPFHLTVASGNSTATVNDVLIGDVWLCSGQSNMQMPVKDCAASEQAIARTDCPGIRLCSVAKGWKPEIESSADIQWRPCSQESARSFSAVGYFFARELTKDPAMAEVPIGVVDSSFGGTTCEGWIPKTALAGFDSAELHDSMFGIKPSMLYNAMIAPLGKSPIKGVIWYQGESNSGHPDTYPRLLATMINEWRGQFATPDLPFFIIQLPDYASQWDGFYWQWEREAQATLVHSTPHTSLVVAINTTDGFNLHPLQKLELGRRTALLARREVYGEPVLAQGPLFKAVQIEDATVRVSFDTGGDGLASSSSDGVRGFALAGDDGVFRFADARIEGDCVVVQSDQVRAPKYVRYAWAGAPNSTLTDKAGLPAAPFRTDTLPYANVEVQKVPVSHEVTTSTYKITIAGNGTITSLIIQGAQFISNAPGMAGGSSLPFGFGSRSLANIQELGPDLLSCSDNDLTLQFKFGEKEMAWTLTNRGKDDAKFNLALSPRVAVSRQNDADPVTLGSKSSSVAITGVDSISDSENGKVLQVVVKGGASKQLTLNTGGK
jgi:sialate O-acetylesterase